MRFIGISPETKLFSAPNVTKLTADIGKLPENLLLLMSIVVICEPNLLGSEPEKPFSWVISIVNFGSDHMPTGKLPLNWLLYNNKDPKLLQLKRDFGSSPDKVLSEKSMYRRARNEQRPSGSFPDCKMKFLF
jgi:hypothetical protein